MTEFVSSLIANYGLLGIFIATFVSYSIFPIPPIEPLIVLALNFFNSYLVFIASILGATSGHILDYIIGLKGIRMFLMRRYPKTEEKARRLFIKLGPMSIVLFSWMPLIGNPIIIIAGSLKMNFWKFLFYSTVGKVWYFILVIWFGNFFISLF